MSVTKMSPSMMTASGKRTTPFGAVENPGLLLNLPDKVILRVDTLACLKEMWGENILMARQHLYELVAGTVSDSDFQELITSYYKRYAAFANYVDEKYLLGSNSCLWYSGLSGLRGIASSSMRSALSPSAR